METSKKPDLYALAQILSGARVAYAIIGGIAVQVHQDEPRTTLDIDVVVPERRRLPTAALRSAGFRETGSFEHSDNWQAPGGTPVQFTDDQLLAEAIPRALEIGLEDLRLRVLSAPDLLRAKLRAAADPARRRSKRLQDLADAQALIERDPALADTLSPVERAGLSTLP